MKVSSDEEAANLATVCGITVVILSISILSGFAALSNMPMALHMIQELPFPPAWITLLPICLIELVSFNVMIHWLNRADKYQEIMKLRMGQNALIGFSQIVAGLIFSNQGLLFGAVIGQFLVMVWAVRKHLGNLKLFFTNVSWSGVSEAFRQHFENPKYILPSVLLDNVSNNLPISILSSYSPLSTIGSFNLARRVLELPTTTVSNAVSQIFYRKFSLMDKKNPKVIKDGIIKIWLILASVGIIPLIVVELWSESIFIAIFGPEWILAGSISRILMPMYYTQFVLASTSMMPLIIGMQGLSFKFNVIKLISRPFAFLLGFQYGLNSALLLFCLTEVVISIGFHVLMYRRLSALYNENK